MAIGTTVVRALEHAARFDGVVRSGEGVATTRIDATSRLRIVDAILSGTHEPGTSHYELLRAFADDQTLARVEQELNAHGYVTHEYGDSVFLFLCLVRCAGTHPQALLARRLRASSFDKLRTTLSYVEGSLGPQALLLRPSSFLLLPSSFLTVFRTAMAAFVPGRRGRALRQGHRLPART